MVIRRQITVNGGLTALMTQLAHDEKMFPHADNIFCTQETQNDAYNESLAPDF